MPRIRARLPAVLTVLGGVAFLTGCGAALLANPRPTAPPTLHPSATPTRPADPQPVEFPRDDGPHDRLTEWWYDTGHLRAADGRQFGFELVVFRAERGVFPVSWASHLALTDEDGDRFLYDQRSEVGPQVDRSVAGEGFDLAVAGDVEPGVPDADAIPWTMAGVGGSDRLAAIGSDRSGVTFGLELSLDGTERTPVLHDGDGYVDFGSAGGSYYTSRTRMDASGRVTLGEERLEVTGTAWFDHQWGDFITVGSSGWDWFAVNLADGTDLTLSLVRALDGTYPLVYGTLVRPDGTAEHLPRDAFTVQVTASWSSRVTGAEYPAGWSIDLPDEELVIDLVPTVADQELDTRATTGVVYWEGSQVVQATRRGAPVEGEAYVELTGYGPGVEG